MTDGTSFIELKLDLEKPAELRDLVSSFTALAGQFEAYLEVEHPELNNETKLFVKEVRQGSIIVELLPFIPPLINTMDVTLIVDDFIRRYGRLVTGYIEGTRFGDARKTDLKDFNGTVAIIAKDTDGKATISSAIYHETKTTKRAVFEFNTTEAKQALDEIEQHQHDIEVPAYEKVENVLMVYWQSNVKEHSIGVKRTGERVVIEAVHKKPLPLVYETELVEQRIKHEIQEGRHNLYKLGFYVDCHVERLRGKAVAYRLIDLRDIILLPDDDDPQENLVG